MQQQIVIQPFSVWWSLATIFAVLAGPILALTVQKKLDIRREKAERKRRVFSILMLTRPLKLSAQHVEALNQIEIEFYSEHDDDDRKVINAWRVYLDHLNTKSEDGNAWITRADDLLNRLLFEMSQNLGYKFTEVELKRNAYIPNFFYDVEGELHALRKAQLKVFSGEQPLVIREAGEDKSRQQTTGQ